MNGKSCALTGHREIESGFDENRLYDKLEELIQSGYDYFYCGMAQGFDLLALGCLCDLKRKYKIFVEACIPYAGQENYFPVREKKKYRELLQWCDKKTVLSEFYYDGCLLRRNRYMADGADAVLAYCKTEKGGTAYTVHYAQKNGIPVFFI